MRHLLRLLLAVFLLCTILLSRQIAPVYAQDAAYNPDAEAYIRSELLLDGSADLAIAFSDPDARTVRADFIISLWQDPDFENLSIFKLSNLTIIGDLQAKGISIPFNVGFENCRFIGQIDMDSASTKTFRLDKCQVQGAVKMGRLNVNGDLALYESTFQSKVTLFDADISNNLFARGSQFLATITDTDSKYPFELWKTHVGQSTEFSNSVIKGEASAEDARFGADARFDGTIFEKPAYFTNMQVGELADFHNATFKDTVTFENAILNRDIKFTEAVFEKDAKFDYLSVERFFDFDNAIVNQGFSIQYPTIGWPYFAGTTFNGPVNFEGMQTENDFELTDVSYTYDQEPFTVYLAKVDGQALFNGFTTSTGLDLSHNVFGDLEISGNETSAIDTLRLNGTVVDGDLTIDNLRVNEFSANELEVADKTTITRLTVIKNLNFSNASLGFFTIDDQGFWPRPTGETPNSNLRGMLYNDIGLVKIKTTENQDPSVTTTELQDIELEDATWPVLLNMVNQSEYSPQAYRTLGQFLTEKGHPEWAAEVEFQRKNRERNDVLKAFTLPWFWSWFSCLFSGYGQIPGLALIWSFLVITIGAIFYWKESNLIVLDQSEARPAYNPFLYSFALFVPFIDLDFAGKWEPNPKRRVAWLYKYILKILGWILTPIALLTFGGVLS